MEAALIAFVPSALMLGLFVGSVAIYMVMTQQKILALARIPQHLATFYNVTDWESRSIVERYQQAGYRIKYIKRNRRTDLFEISMELVM